MDVDEILEEVGGFGTYQQRIVALTVLISIFSDNQYVVNLLSTETTGFSCINGYENSALSFGNLYMDNKMEYDFTKGYVIDNETGYVNNHENATNSHQKGYLSDTDQCSYMAPDTNNASILISTKCTKWSYDSSMFISTAATEFNLVCDKEWLRHFARSCYMIGMLSGSMILGSIGNRFGRKIGLFCSMLLLLTGGFVSYVLKNYYVFMLMQIFVGAGSTGTFQNSLLIGVEIVSKNWRCEIGLLLMALTGLGRAMMSLVAYFLRDWRILEVAVTAPMLLFIILIWLLPENPRWLLIKERKDDVIKFFEKTAKINKVPLPQSLVFYRSKISDESCVEKGEKIITNEEKVEKSGSKKGFVDILKSKKMRRDVSILYLAWIVGCLVFYGISAHSSNISGNIYVNIFLTMLIDVPACLLAIVINNKYGRKATIVYSSLFTGIVCLSSGPFEESFWPMLILSLLGKVGVAISYNTTVLYTSELLPTQFRSSILGSCSMISRLGGIVAPFISSLAKFYHPLPLLITGSVSIVAALIFSIMPETKGRPLLQTLEEYENMPDADSMFSCCSCFDVLSKQDNKPDEPMKLTAGAA